MRRPNGVAYRGAKTHPVAYGGGLFVCTQRVAFSAGRCPIKIKITVNFTVNETRSLRMSALEEVSVEKGDAARAFEGFLLRNLNGAKDSCFLGELPGKVNEAEDSCELTAIKNFSSLRDKLRWRQTLTGPSIHFRVLPQQHYQQQQQQQQRQELPLLLQLHHQRACCRSHKNLSASKLFPITKAKFQSRV